MGLRIPLTTPHHKYTTHMERCDLSPYWTSRLFYRIGCSQDSERQFSIETEPTGDIDIDTDLDKNIDINIHTDTAI